MNTLIRRFVLLVVILTVGFGVTITGSLALFTASTSVALPPLQTDVWRFYLHSGDWGPARGIQPGHGGVPHGQGGIPPGQDKGGGYEPGLYAMDSVYPTSTSVKTFDPASAIHWGTMVVAADRLVRGGDVGFWTNIGLGQGASLILSLVDHNSDTKVDVTICSLTTTRANWMNGATAPLYADYLLPAVTYTVPAGHVIALVTSSPNSALKVYFDSTIYPAFFDLH